MRFISAPPGIYKGNPLWLTLRDFQISAPDTAEKGPALLLKPVLVAFPALALGSARTITAPRPLDAGGHIRIHQDRQIGLQVPAQNLMERANWLAAQLAPSTLVRLAGVGKAVAKDELTFGQGRLNNFFNMLSPRSKHQGKFSKRREVGRACIQEQVANLLSGHATARFSGYDNLQSVGPQGACQLLHLRALAAPVKAFDGNKSAALRHEGIITKPSALSFQRSVNQLRPRGRKL